MISEATIHFKNGEIVIFPSDTVYGVGCIISNQESIKKLYKIRKSPLSKPTLILAARFDQAALYGNFNGRAKRLAQHFWPGPLTIVVKAKEPVPKTIQGGTGTVGIRVPDFPWLRGLIEEVGEPIAAPSANFHGQPAPASYAQIDKKLLSLVDYAIDLTDLRSSFKMLKTHSTVVDLTIKPYKIVRAGYISESKIKEALGGA